MNVVTTASTVFYSDPGATVSLTDFFTALATTPTVALQGTYDSATNTFTATGISITDHANDGGWEHAPHNFRPGDDAGNWGHGVVGRPLTARPETAGQTMAPIFCSASRHLSIQKRAIRHQ